MVPVVLIHYLAPSCVSASVVIRQLEIQYNLPSLVFRNSSTRYSSNRGVQMECLCSFEMDAQPLMVSKARVRTVLLGSNRIMLISESTNP